MPQPNTSALHDAATFYVSRLGWALTPLRPRSKMPMPMEWNSAAAAVRTVGRVNELWGRGQEHGIGLVHEHSGTGTFDIDSLEWAAIAFAEFGIEINELIAGCLQIVGRPGHGKALFRVPPGLSTIKLVWPAPAPGLTPITVFELRAGEVQDVLPPSIHPDTDKPYTWVTQPGDPIPEVPAQLLAIWRAWKDFKPQFEAACPWADKPAAPEPAVRSVSGAHSNVIGRFNAQTSIIDLLQRHGYRPSGKRWLAPTSSTGIPGVVVFEDGRCYSHHASDPLANGHANDAFDVLCMLEYGGDATRAIKAVSSTLRAAEPAVDISALVRKTAVSRDSGDDSPHVAAMPPVPTHLLSVPGALHQATQWIGATAYKPQPLFDVQAALAVGSTALGRRFRTDNGNWSSLYLLNVGKSGSGKEHAKHATEKLLEAGGLSGLIGPGRFASEAGIVSALIQAPTCLAVLDEFGKVLEEATRSGNQHGQSVVRALMEVWGRVDGIVRPTAYSTAGLSSRQAEELAKRFIRKPALSLLAMTTPEPLFSAVAFSWARDGFLNRILTVHSDVGRQEARRVPPVGIPSNVVTWLAEVRTRNPSGGNLGSFEVCATDEPTPTVIPISSQAGAMFTAFERDNIARANLLDEEGIGEMVGRSTEIAMRLALIVAISLDQREVSADAAQWAIDYVRVHAERNIVQLREHLSDSPFDKLVKAIYHAIVRQGTRGATERDLGKLCRAWAAATTNVADAAIDRLKRTGRIVLVTMPAPSGRGRNRVAWVADALLGANGDDLPT